MSFRRGTLLAAVVMSGCAGNMTSFGPEYYLYRVMDLGVPARKAVFEGGAPLPPSATEGPAADRARLLLVDGDEAWKNRGAESELRTALARWEESAQANPTGDAYVRLARGWHFLAESVDGPAAARLDAYDRATTAAESALVYDGPDFAKAVRRGAWWEDAAKAASPSLVPALYWYAVNLGQWARARGPYFAFANRDRVRALMAQCLRLDPDYFHAGPHRYFGAYYAAAPKFGGGDVDKSEAHFRQSLSRSPGWLATRVQMADSFAVRKGDRVLFEKLLRDVLASEISADSDEAPEQELAKRQAEALLGQARALF